MTITKKITTMVLTLAALTILFSSCAQRKAVVKEEEPAVKEAPKAEPAEKVQVTEPISEADVQVEGLEREGVDVSSRDVMERFDDIHFDFDQYAIRPEDEATLKRLANWLIRNAGSRVTVEGHCDERGTAEYNLALGERRATAVQRYLAANGVDPSRVNTVSYGEERPVDPGHNESAWSRNRRAHFVVSR